MCKILCYKGKGIQYVRDILDDHGKIINWQAARSKFDLHDKDFMVWLSLKIYTIKLDKGN